MIRTGMVLALVVLFAAGCSSDGEGEKISSGQDVADMVGCTGFTNDSEEMFVSEGGSCELDGETISVYYFADDDAQGSYVEMGADFGGNYLFGDGWVIGAPSATLDAIEEEHGGERP